MGARGTNLVDFLKDCEFVPDTLIELWTCRLRNGEVGPKAEGFARAILVDFSLRAMCGRPQSEVTIRWLADCFDRLTEYEDPYAVLALARRPPHRPVGHGVKRAIDVAHWVALAIQRGYTVADAAARAADLFACDVRSVHRMRKAARGWVEGMNWSADWDEYFRLLGRPLPPPHGD